jgi:hypothetical protein
MATRTRAETACYQCKTKKARCSDYRPCARCSSTGSEVCTEGTVLKFKDSGFTPNDSHNLFCNNFEASQLEQKTISGLGVAVSQIQYMTTQIEMFPPVKVRARSIPVLSSNAHIFRFIPSLVSDPQIRSGRAILSRPSFQSAATALAERFPLPIRPPAASHDLQPRHVDPSPRMDVGGGGGARARGPVPRGLAVPALRRERLQGPSSYLAAASRYGLCFCSAYTVAGYATPHHFYDGLARYPADSRCSRMQSGVVSQPTASGYVHGGAQCIKMNRTAANAWNATDRRIQRPPNATRAAPLS